MAKAEDGSVRLVPIEWDIGTVPLTFANNMIVQADGHEVHISFFQIRPPIITENDAVDREDVIRKIGSVRAECVARLVVSKTRFLNFARAIQQHVDRLEESSDEGTGEGDS